VINEAGYARIGEVAGEQKQCCGEAAGGPERLAQASARHGIRFVTFSSDLVFDGRLGRPYVELDPICPTCHFGCSKAEAEARVTFYCPAAMIVRTSALFGPWDTYNFVHQMLSRLAAGQRVALSTAHVLAPTYVPDLADPVLDLLIDDETGIWHLSNAGSASWYDLGRMVAARAGLSEHSVAPDTGEARNTALTSVRGRLMHSLEDAIGRFFRDCEADWRKGGPIVAD